MSALEIVGKRQASWSTTAGRMKFRLEVARGWIFTLAIVGAIVATIASQSQDRFRAYAAIVGAIMLGVGTLLTSRLGNATQNSRWVRARAIAEALKREAFRFAAKASPYGGDNADSELSKARERIEGGIDDDLAVLLIDVDRLGSTPTTTLSPAEYVEARVAAQIRFYRNAAGDSRRRASRLRTVEFLLALAATVMTAVVGMLEKYPVPDLRFDFAALTAAITTIGGLVLSHIESSRYDFLVMTYGAAARKLEQALSELDATGANSQNWSAFVERCESIIANENNSWIVKRMST